MSKSYTMEEVLAKSPLPLIGICGGLGSSTAEVITFAFDNIKTRMQMNGKEGLPTYNGLFDCMKRTYTDNGIPGFYRGLSAAIFRQITYSTTRITVYEYMRRNLYTKEQNEKFIYKFIAGGTGGAVGCVIGTPGDVLKIRLINDFTKQKYKGIFDCAGQIYAMDGFMGFMKGLNVNIARAIIVNAAELSAYDQAKVNFVKYLNLSPTSLTTHFFSSCISGLFAAILSSPSDVVKTRYMNQAKNQTGEHYSSAIDCFMKVLKAEGVSSMYKGFFAYYLRIAPWNVAMFMSYEQYKAMILPKYLGY